MRKFRLIGAAMEVWRGCTEDYLMVLISCFVVPIFRLTHRERHVLSIQFLMFINMQAINKTKKQNRHPWPNSNLSKQKCETRISLHVPYEGQNHPCYNTIHATGEYSIPRYHCSWRKATTMVNLISEKRCWFKSELF